MPFLTSGNASGSVCPKGWTLPSGDSGDYKKLADRYYIKDNSTGSAKIRSTPLSFNYNGYYNYYSGSLSGTTSWSHYWSRTAYSSAAYDLYFDSSRVNPSDYYSRANGHALRCVAR